MTSLAHTEPDLYVVRMARVNISIPEELLARARARKLDISEVARRALETDLRRLDNADGMAMLQAEMEADLGVPTDEEMAEARAWADRVYRGVEE